MWPRTIMAGKFRLKLVDWQYTGEGLFLEINKKLRENTASSSNVLEEMGVGFFSYFTVADPIYQNLITCMVSQSVCIFVGQ